MKIWKRVAVSAGVLLLLLLVYGVAIEPYRLDVSEEPAPLPNLPAAWAGREIGVVADWQLGMWMANESTVRRSVRTLVERRPAAVLIAGDFVYHADGRLEALIPEMERMLRPLVEAGIPTYAVLGNHDYSIDVRKNRTNERVARAVAAGLQRVGVKLLVNQAVPLRIRGEPLYLVGIGSDWAHHDDPRAALGEVPAGAARFVFMHNPHSFPRISAGQAPVAVAGHTHGGQIAIPFTPHWSWMSLFRDVPAVADGWTREDYGQSGNRLYVNVGIGFSDLPVRINATPEVTFFRLSRG